MPTPAFTPPAASTPYTGDLGNVPADRSDVTAQVVTGASPPNAATFNYFFQFFIDLFARVWDKAGFLDLASTWTAKQTFTNADVTGNLAVKGNATLGDANTDAHTIHGVAEFMDGTTFYGTTNTFMAGSTLVVNGTATFTPSATGADGLTGNGNDTGNGIAGNGGTTSGAGVKGTGGPSGIGVYGIGGTGNGIGVRGDGFGTEVGVWGNASGTGAGVEGQSGNGPGGRFFRSSTRGAINIVPDAAPSTPQNGDMWIETGTDTLKVRINGVTKTVTLT